MPTPCLFISTPRPRRRSRPTTRWDTRIRELKMAPALTSGAGAVLTPRDGYESDWPPVTRGRDLGGGPRSSRGRWGTSTGRGTGVDSREQVIRNRARGRKSCRPNVSRCRWRIAENVFRRIRGRVPRMVRAPFGIEGRLSVLRCQMRSGAADGYRRMWCWGRERVVGTAVSSCSLGPGRESLGIVLGRGGEGWYCVLRWVLDRAARHSTVRVA